MEILNAAYFIAVQVGVAAIAWGETGIAKTAYIEALARALGKKFYHFIPSIHLPEDLTGIPIHNKAEMFARMVPMEFIAACTEPDWLFLIDEMTTAGSNMRPPLLGLLQERRVGKIVWHPTTMVCAAANPAEWAPNSAPLEPALCNRMYHHPWQFPEAQWRKGMRNGGNFTVDENIPLVKMEDVAHIVPVWTRRIEAFTKAHPTMLRTKKCPDVDTAYPSPRVWHKLSLCLAGAQTVDATPSVYTDLCEGMVGKTAGSQFLEFVAAADLYDVDAVVEGREKVEYGKDRIDQLIHLPYAILCNLRQRAASGKIADKVVDTAIDVMVSMGEHGLLDCVQGPLSEVADVVPDYSIPGKMLTRYGKLIAQVGGDE